MLQKEKEHPQLHNIYYDNSVKNTIYSNLISLIFKPFRYLKSYFIFAQNTRIFETLFGCATLLLMICFFYFLTVFLCAIDNQCAAIYMEVSNDNS